MTVDDHPNGIRVRPATATDRDRCLDLIATLTGRPPTPPWAATLDRLLAGDRGAAVVAELDGVVVGCATVSYNLAIRYGGEYAQLEELIVDPSATGLGLGRILVQRTIDDARRRGCAEMGLYLVASTEGNRGFYQKLGFEIVGTELRQALDG